MAQSQQGEGPAAEETEAAGAAAGTEGEQRAPIDAPAGGTNDAAVGREQVL